MNPEKNFNNDKSWSKLHMENWERNQKSPVYQAHFYQKKIQEIDAKKDLDIFSKYVNILELLRMMKRHQHHRLFLTEFQKRFSPEHDQRDAESESTAFSDHDTSFIDVFVERVEDVTSPLSNNHLYKNLSLDETLTSSNVFIPNRANALIPVKEYIKKSRTHPQSADIQYAESIAQAQFKHLKRDILRATEFFLTGAAEDQFSDIEKLAGKDLDTILDSLNEDEQDTHNEPESS